MGWGGASEGLASMFAGSTYAMLITMPGPVRRRVRTYHSGVAPRHCQAQPAAGATEPTTEAGALDAKAPGGSREPAAGVVA